MASPTGSVPTSPTSGALLSDSQAQSLAKLEKVHKWTSWIIHALIVLGGGAAWVVSHPIPRADATDIVSRLLWWFLRNPRLDTLVGGVAFVCSLIGGGIGSWIVTFLIKDIKRRNEDTADETSRQSAWRTVPVAWSIEIVSSIIAFVPALIGIYYLVF